MVSRATTAWFADLDFVFESVPLLLGNVGLVERATLGCASALGGGNVDGGSTLEVDLWPVDNLTRAWSLRLLDFHLDGLDGVVSAFVIVLGGGRAWRNIVGAIHADERSTTVVS